MATLTPAAASFHTWGTEHGEHISFGGTPKAGDAVILYPPGTTAANGSYADHVGIVTAVHSDGTVNLVNGDFLGRTNIAVRYIADAHLTAWASRVEGSQGEDWALVSPVP
jgi:CHAP domain